jgi:hypothetical protein
MEFQFFMQSFPIFGATLQGICIRAARIHIPAPDGMPFGPKKRIFIVFKGENSPKRYSYKGY